MLFQLLHEPTLCLQQKLLFPLGAPPKFRQVQQELYLIRDKSVLCPIQLQIAPAPKKVPTTWQM